MRLPLSSRSQTWHCFSIIRLDQSPWSCSRSSLTGQAADLAFDLASNCRGWWRMSCAGLARSWLCPFWSFCSFCWLSCPARIWKDSWCILKQTHLCLCTECNCQDYFSSDGIFCEPGRWTSRNLEIFWCRTSLARFSIAGVPSGFSWPLTLCWRSLTSLGYWSVIWTWTCDWPGCAYSASSFSNPPFIKSSFRLPSQAF